MTADPIDEKAVFNVARRIESRDARAEYLQKVCGANSEELRRLIDLLEVYDHERSFLESPAVAVNATADAPHEHPGSQIGPYKLLEQIGDGGFGVVYLAEQERPVRRKVALKVIKPGMDTRQVIARFEAERQALAMMDHPNIAKVHDAGATENGRPYFVMELVQGVPITEYCDQCNLMTRERLELFITVCQAVQHAHQKGIIHRDLKPSNILVTIQDGKAAPKIIDFGVAKAINQRFTEQTLATGFAQMIGTPLYMSPEQAELSPLGVDTRSDIYSLGMLLYELLTGTTPFEASRLKEAGFDELRRIIREEEPPRPSWRISTTAADMATTIAERRRTDARRLMQTVRGDLDWIVMKCLEKDRMRRYATASELAADVDRFLMDEPVMATPPSPMYRFRKFARRNKTALATSVALGIAVLVAVAAVAGSLSWIAREKVVRQERLTAQLDAILADADRLMDEKNWPEALAAAKRANAALAAGEANRNMQQKVSELLKDLRFIDDLEQIRMEAAMMLGQGNHQKAVDQHYAQSFAEYGVDVDKLPVEASIARLSHRPALTIPIAAALDEWASTRRRSTENARDWQRLFRIAQGIDDDAVRNEIRALAGREITADSKAELRRIVESIDVSAQHPRTLLLLSNAIMFVSRDDAIEFLHKALIEHPQDYWLNQELGFVSFAKAINEQATQGKRRYEEAIRYFTAAVSLRPNAYSLHSLGWALSNNGQDTEAEAVLRKAILLFPDNSDCRVSLARLLKRQGKLAEAEAIYGELIKLSPDAFFHVELGELRAAQGKWTEAEKCYRDAIELAPKFARAHNALAIALRDQTRYDEAIEAFADAIGQEPKMAEAHFHLGNAYWQQGKADLATASYRTAAELRPNDGNAHFNLGRALISQGQLDEAIMAFRRVIEINPSDNKSHLDLGRLYASSSKWQDAVELYEHLVLDEKVRRLRNIRSQPTAAGSDQSAAPTSLTNDDHFRFERACLSLLVSDRKAYQRICAEFLEPQDPKPRGFLVARAATLAADSMDDLTAAEKAATAELTGNDQYWALTASAGILYRNRRFEDAMELLHKCLNENPQWDGKVLNWLWLSLSCHRLGKETEAQRWLDKARSWFDEQQGRLPWPTEGHIALHLHDWLEAHILLREAEEVLKATMNNKN